MVFQDASLQTKLFSTRGAEEMAMINREGLINCELAYSLARRNSLGVRHQRTSAWSLSFRRIHLDFLMFAEVAHFRQSSEDLAFPFRIIRNAVRALLF